MTPKEVSKLMTLAIANFPNMQEKDMDPTLVLWREMLSDMPFEVAKAALIKVLATAKFWPTIAEIREAALDVTGQKGLTPAEAWALVEQADEKYGYYRADEAMKSLPPVVQQTVRAMGGFSSISSSENPGVTRGQFMKMYEQFATREKEMAVLPANIRKMITDATRLLPEVGNEH